MNDFSRSQILQSNERIKGISGLGFNLSVGVIGATAARIYLTLDVDMVAVVWSMGAIALIWASSKILTLLDAEE
ncbi:hypothetical protein GCM10007897_36030 [Sphingobium jiangsuense]|uniref:Uncharacterized protein n=1 Tax=Sphingobium jiangsuense TaxID=870476 RepID=A0A7W6BKI3_9SPHN|nr:hypothetical protein [Sphingobium jiangsuense]MBB3928745.1 hypothetical protein [Sphingobium jiangsuense]GLT02198.1 hypothetical protein GCM10007897_36030 [Sphingobium jiangsuense]